MGIGDEIMVTGEVRRLAGQRPRLFAIWDRRKDMHRWNEIWDRNPRIARPGQPYDEKLYNHGGGRPYILQKMETRWLWRAFEPTPGELFLSPTDIMSQAKGRVIIQPAIKAGASVNKVWGMKQWQRLIELCPNVPWLQIGEGHEPRVEGVPFLQTPSFKHAAGALSLARAAVLQEGGLHHAAAALGIPAVVIFGGFISPACTGYKSHRNLFAESAEYPLGCGMRIHCGHCVSAMRAIYPQLVQKEMEAVL